MHKLINVVISAKPCKLMGDERQENHTLSVKGSVSVKIVKNKLLIVLFLLDSSATDVLGHTWVGGSQATKMSGYMLVPE